MGDADLENISITVSAGFDIPVKVTVEGRSNDPGLSFGLVQYPARSFFSNLVGMRPGTPQFNLLNTKEFTIEGVKPGDYQFSFFSIGSGSRALLQSYVKAMRMGSTDVLNGLLHVDGPPQSPLEIVIGTNGGTLDGAVVSDREEAVANVNVAVVPDAPYRGRADLYKTGTTDASGHFHILGIAPGNYRVFSFDDVGGYAWQDPEFIRVYEGRGRPIHVAENSKQNLQLTLIR